MPINADLVKYLFDPCRNGAVLRNQKVIDLFKDDDKLTSFFENVLVPIVTSLKDEPGIGSWEIINGNINLYFRYLVCTLA